MKASIKRSVVAFFTQEYYDTGMPAETGKDTWQKLCKKLEPSTHAKGDIETVTVQLRNGGIIARTSQPRLSVEEIENREDLNSQRWESLDEIPSNEDIFIYEDFGVDIKNTIFECLEAAIVNTPVNCSVSFRRAIIDEDYIRPVFRVSLCLPNDSNNLYNELAEALASEGSLDDVEQFAYGSIDTCWFSEEGITEGWEFDGTLHKYTQKPYEWWSEGPDTDEPSDMDSWVDFAADTEAERQQIRNRDKHVVHFHPMERGLSKNHPYIQWFKKAEDILYDNIELSGSEESFRLTSVNLDESRVKLEGSLTA